MARPGSVSPRIARAASWARLPVNRSAIHSLAGPRDHLKVQIVAGNFVEHETLILVEAGRRVRRTPKIALAKLSAGARHEVRDAFLRFQTLVYVIVTGIDHVYAILDEDPLEHDAQIE